MLISLNEQELQKALGVYLNTLFNTEVSVHNVDLSGMRSSAGLSASIDFSLEGQPYIPANKETPKEERKSSKMSSSSVEEEETLTVTASVTSNLSQEDSSKYYHILNLLNDNSNNCNTDKIQQLVSGASPELIVVLSNNTYYQEWVKTLNKTSAEESIKKEFNESNVIKGDFEEPSALEEEVAQMGKLITEEKSNKETEEELPFEPDKQEKPRSFLNTTKQPEEAAKSTKKLFA